MVADVTLKRTEKNDVLTWIKKHGLDLAVFEWTEKVRVEGDGIDQLEFLVSVLTHHPTGYYFTFGSFYIDFSPGPTLKEQHEHHHGSWVSKRKYFDGWLWELRKKVDAP